MEKATALKATFGRLPEYLSTLRDLREKEVPYILCNLNQEKENGN